MNPHILLSIVFDQLFHIALGMSFEHNTIMIQASRNPVKDYFINEFKGTDIILSKDNVYSIELGTRKAKYSDGEIESLKQDEFTVKNGIILIKTELKNYLYYLKVIKVGEQNLFVTSPRFDRDHPSVDFPKFSQEVADNPLVPAMCRLEYDDVNSSLENEVYEVQTIEDKTFSIWNGDGRLNHYFSGEIINNRADIRYVRLKENETPNAGEVRSLGKGVIRSVESNLDKVTITVANEKRSLDDLFLRKVKDFDEKYTDYLDEEMPIAYGRCHVDALKLTDYEETDKDSQGNKLKNEYLFADPGFTKYWVHKVYLKKEDSLDQDNPLEFTHTNGIIYLPQSVTDDVVVDFTSDRSNPVHVGGVSSDKIIIDLMDKFSDFKNNSDNFNLGEINKQTFNKIRFYFSDGSLLDAINKVLAGAYCYLIINHENKYTLRNYDFDRMAGRVVPDRDLKIRVSDEYFASEVLFYSRFSYWDEKHNRKELNNQYDVQAVANYGKRKRRKFYSLLTEDDQATKLNDFLAQKYSNKQRILEIQTTDDLSDMNLLDKVIVHPKVHDFEVMKKSYFQIYEINKPEGRLTLRETKGGDIS